MNCSKINPNIIGRSKQISMLRSSYDHQMLIFKFLFGHFTVDSYHKFKPNTYISSSAVYRGTLHCQYRILWICLPVYTCSLRLCDVYLLAVRGVHWNNIVNKYNSVQIKSVMNIITSQFCGTLERLRFLNLSAKFLMIDYLR